MNEIPLARASGPSRRGHDDARLEYALNELGRRLVPAIEAIAEVGEELKRRAADDAPPAAATPRLRHFRATLGPAADAGK